MLPIPPGTHWSDAKPIVLPTAGVPGAEIGDSGVKALPCKRVRKPKKDLVVVNPSAIVSGGLRFGALVPSVIEQKVEVKEKKITKNDPRLVAAARELKDRWLKQVNSGMYLPMANGKYEVCRSMEMKGHGKSVESIESMKILSSPVAA